MTKNYLEIGYSTNAPEEELAAFNKEIVTYLDKFYRGLGGNGLRVIEPEEADMPLTIEISKLHKSRKFEVTLRLALRDQADSLELLAQTQDHIDSEKFKRLVEGTIQF